MFRPPGAPTRRRQGSASAGAAGLTATPSAWYSWDFDIEFRGQTLCRLDLANFRDEARFDLEGRHYTIKRLSRRGAFVLAQGEEHLISAVKPNVWRNRLEMTVRGTPYVLRPNKILGRRFALYQGAGEGNHEVGFVEPISMWSRRLRASLPQTFTPLEQIFTFYLVITRWRNDARAAGAT